MGAVGLLGGLLSGFRGAWFVEYPFHRQVWLPNSQELGWGSGPGVRDRMWAEAPLALARLISLGSFVDLH